MEEDPLLDLTSSSREEYHSPFKLKDNQLKAIFRWYAPQVHDENENSLQLYSNYVPFIIHEYLFCVAILHESLFLFF